MKNIFPVALLAFCTAFLLFVSSCTDPLDVGTELLTEDRAAVGFTDTLKIQARTTIADSVRVYSSDRIVMNDFLFGNTSDPYFGETKAGIYMQPLLSRNTDAGGNFIEFKISDQSIIDSIILILPLDSSAIIGDIAGLFGIDVFEVIEPISVEENDDGEEAYFSNISFDTNPTPLASTTFVPSFDSVFVKDVINTISDDTIKLIRPHVRIALDPALGQRLLDMDTLTFEKDSSFLEAFKGLYLEPTGTSAGLLDFRLNNVWAGMYIYYRDQNDTLSYSFELGFAGKRISQYTHTYTGSVVGDFLDDNEQGDSLLFMQGMQGLLIEFEIPGLATFQNKVINKAELEFTVATFEDYDLDAYPPIKQIIALKRNDEGQLVTISDVSLFSNELSFYFKGQPVKQDDGSTTYTLNLSVHSQFLLDGTEPETIYLAISPRVGNANRVILKGAGSETTPAVLKVSFTDI